MKNQKSRILTIIGTVCFIVIVIFLMIWMWHRSATPDEDVSLDVTNVIKSDENTAEPTAVVESENADTATTSENAATLDVRYIILNQIDNRTVNTIYTGITEKTGEIAIPKENHCYILVNYHFTDGFLPYETTELIIAGKKYDEAADNERLLALLGHAPLKNMDDEKRDYYSVFEVELSDAEVDSSEWYLNYNGEMYSLEGKLNFTLPEESLLIAEQWEIEKKIMSDYAQKGYTIKEPYVVVNPYGNAPLTALVLFETEEPEKISITIEGKTEETTFSYDFNTYDTHHEVPIIGLYADHENQVILQSFGADGQLRNTETLTIQTQYLPDDINMDAPEVYRSEYVNDDLFFLINGRRTVVDVNGDVRWFLREYRTVAAVSHVMDNGHFVMSTDAFTEYAEIIEMDFLGKIHWSYYDGGAAHHDLNIAPDGNIAFIGSHNCVKVIDRENYTTVKEFDFDIFREGKEDLEIRHSAEVLHVNTINFADDDMILSFRNQHMVVNMNYYTEEIKWILSPSVAYYPELADYFLTPVGDNFEWFYSQHEPTIMPDMDNNPDTTDVLLFDNGDARGFYGEKGLPLEERYSRIVHYRIDEVNRTVEQIYEFGKEYGFELFSSIHSGAKYLENEEAYLGAFDAWGKGDDYDADGYQSQVIQADKDGNVNWRMKMPTGHYLYRCYKDSFSSLYRGIVPLYSERSDLFVNASTLSSGGEYENGEITYNISSMEQKGQYLNIFGWAHPDEVHIDNYPVYLQLDRSDGVSYRYLLPKTDSIDFSDEFKGILNPKGDSKYFYRGFASKYIDLNLIEEGEYTLSLVFKVGEKIIGQHIQYSVTVDKQSLDMYGILSQQKTMERSAIANYNSAEGPRVRLNPYGIAPLTAVIEFETANPARVDVVVAGKDEISTIRHSFETYESMHQVPVYGLYPGTNNEVVLTVTDDQGNTQDLTVEIQTDPLPDDFIQIDIKQKKAEYQAEGLNFITSTLSGMVGFDTNGDIRWYTPQLQTFGYLCPVKALKNGNFAIFGGEMVSPYYNSHVLEVNLLGKIINKYEIPRNSGHHDIVEMENGNLLVLTGHTTVGVVEDSMIEFDRVTGEIVRSIDFKDVLPLKDYLPSNIYLEENRATALSNLKAEGVAEPTETQINEETAEISAHDWFHANAFAYDPQEGSITVCSRNLNSIVKFDYETLELIWIFADPQNNAYTDNPELQKYLLTSTDAAFIYTYGQHSVNYLNNGKLILFDNRYNDNALHLTEDESDSYSRIAVFNIDETARTIELAWEWGKERGNELYSCYVSNVQALSDDHMLCNFGGIVYDKETNVRTRNIGSVFTGNSGTEAVIVELDGDEVIFEAQVLGNGYNNVYRCYRINPYGER